MDQRAEFFPIYHSVMIIVYLTVTLAHFKSLLEDACILLPAPYLALLHQIN